MESKNKKGIFFSRRGSLALLGSFFFLPFFGMTKQDQPQSESSDDEEYQTLLKPDGTTVKVKVSTIQKSKVVKDKLSNKSLLNWLGRKL